MKFINYLQSIAGISIYPMASLLIFSGFFLIAAWWAFKADKNMVDHISRIPLDNDETNSL
ncbi:CcoQ/FixQ family Cbb3-type cytochrome c oxidase assembly chaperone [Chitinophaga nivalis]|uniref:CcoQ/FixQ family Cbb3-type cytochrome c oxidase assembly chaperone n=1 Tax=Chitinophaga nivalis TaxID=2991709 RepID=A0ABT3IVW0_9BACT|nr:CcoQ/FixQ family Cbb3-type cytochrome c oxidase assembly chaperone [Chitinophaga nivalis]MCW3462470.1 CcoQ/FixQ family Cbb3-type cytochrome c oxidase assembly chaperone [Chitinophaga nivalis]MCW3487839.1 CcoQ/FixQ family Cbb3-type cytochrome c oxidase assembly chaperone [Chitinophaga nivalis]